MTENCFTPQYYHKAWLASDTEDNFFRWLDRGDGKDLTMDECPRQRLEQEVCLISHLLLCAWSYVLR
jgi:hypothetical protein